MTRKAEQSVFPLARGIGLLTLTALTVECGVIVALPTFWHRPGAADRQAALAAGVIVWSMALAGLLPLVMLGPRGVMWAAGGWVLGGIMRMAGSLALALGVVGLSGLPGDTLLWTLAALYLPMLFVESALAGRYLWNMDSPAMGGAESNRGQPEI